MIGARMHLVFSQGLPMSTSLPEASGAALALSLNRDCHCISLNRQKLHQRLAADLQEKGLPDALLDQASHLFAQYPVFLWDGHIQQMQALIAAVERVVSLPAYRQLILNRQPWLSDSDDGAAGVFYGYDFHLGQEGPQLIEINTNAGGVLLNHYLAEAQQACCQEIEDIMPDNHPYHPTEAQLVDMFREEFAASHPQATLTCIAIVDEQPDSQFLYPEFLLFQSLFARHGIKALIASPADFRQQDGNLMLGAEKVDLVYNRLTDFYLAEPGNRVLRQAYLEKRAVITPSPLHYALYADKRNLVLLSDPDQLEALAIDHPTRHTLLTTIPRTIAAGPDLWTDRKQYFFKPIQGYGSKGSYRGAKMTRKVFDAITAGDAANDYVAQHLVPPSERQLMIEDEPLSLKMDFRCVTYRGVIQQVSSRLYQGQTTNMRTKGGGLATVFPSPDEEVLT